MIELYVVVGDEEEARAAAEKWRFVTRAFKRFGDNPDPAAIQHQAKADVPLEEVIDTWVVSADAAAHVAAIEKLFDQGATVVSIHSGQKDQQKVVDFYGGSVLPQLHHH